MNRPITNFVLSINHDMFKHGPACFIIKIVQVYLNSA